jgi:hypothetical protein
MLTNSRVFFLRKLARRRMRLFLMVGLSCVSHVEVRLTETWVSGAFLGMATDLNLTQAVVSGTIVGWGWG